MSSPTRPSQTVAPLPLSVPQIYVGLKNLGGLVLGVRLNSNPQAYTYLGYIAFAGASRGNSAIALEVGESEPTGDKDVLPQWIAPKIRVGHIYSAERTRGGCTRGIASVVGQLVGYVFARRGRGVARELSVSSTFGAEIVAEGDLVGREHPRRRRVAK